ncbi:hypothetical protein ACFP81_11345 [Deinococcus lacus]|uniref:Uncharacterized protein n=1 Tax=Deinococcus lacus TaxID=392561 RepID=A0ABW1YDW3_9DEIO
MAVENARLYEEESRREREAAALLDISRLLSESAAGEPGVEWAGTAALQEVLRLSVLALRATRGLLVLHAGAGSAAQTICYNLYPPGPQDLDYLAAQLGRGPRALPRRAAGGGQCPAGAAAFGHRAARLPLCR